LHAPRLTTIVKRVLKKPVGTTFESQWKAK
jgi:hypothetical protein